MVEANAPAVEDSMFHRVNVDRASQVIVDQIKLLIGQGRLAPGDRLPSERELCNQFGVSRVTVREALRVLEANGLVAIRVGAQGGAFLTSPSAEQVGEGLANLLRLSPLTASAVTEARQVVELAVLPLVIERATSDDIAELVELLDRADAEADHGRYSMHSSADFHIRVAACTHNAAIEMLVQSFHGPMLMSLEEAQVVAPLMGRKGAQEHRALVEAIERRDLESARTIMGTHLRRTAKRVAAMERQG